MEKTGKQKTEKFDFRSIKSIDDALMKTGKDRNEVFKAGDTVDETAYKVLKELFKAVNNNVKVDYSNSKQKKHYGIFDLSSGCRFMSSCYYCTYSDSVAGVRLCALEERAFEHLAETFPQIFTDYLT